MEYQLISQFTEPTMIEQVLINRGIKKENIQHFLNTSKNDVLPPELIKNLREGVRLLISHIKRNNKIYMIVDSDCDGFASSALFINYLNCIFPHYVQTNIVYSTHEGKEHGIVLDDVPKDVQLVIAIDSSSNDYDIHRHLDEMGIDVLVIDHHEAEKISEHACVINNQLCDYPTKSLSGAGMAYKFCCYIDELLGVSHAEKFLDLVALALIADMVDQRDFETFYLINSGLKAIRNPYFSEMVERNKRQFENGITPISVAFYVAPFINAINRSGTQEEKKLIFESMLDFKAYELIPSTKRGCKGQFETRVEQAGRTSINVKNRQKTSRDTGLEEIKDLIEEKDLLKNKILIVQLENNNVDKNLAGLIANQLANEYQRPTLILRKIINDSDGTISWEGSARDYGIITLKNFLSSSNLIMYAEGHQQAFGIGILDIQMERFIDWVDQTLADTDFTIKYDVDFIFDAKDLNENDIYGIGDYSEIWGQNLNEPLILIKNVKVSSDNLRYLGSNQKTLRIDLPQDRISLVKFNITDEEKEYFDPKEGQIILNVIGRFQRNVWNGYSSPQILIEDYEVIKWVEYYF